MQKIRLQILGLSFSQMQDNAYVLILAEENSERRIPIIIGGAEAQSIAIELEHMKAPRPLTHDLFVSLAKNFDIDLKEVLIYKLEEGVFYSRLIIQQNDKIIHIDSRTSDAVALAVRFDCPIFAESSVIERAGIILNTEDSLSEDKFPKEKTEQEKPIAKSTFDYAFETLENLEVLLQEAIDCEDYEKASHIRDEIKKRS